MPKSRKPRAVSLYANLSSRLKTNKDLKSRRRAERLATLPKHPVKRLFYRLHPKRFFSYWFSKDGRRMVLKIIGVGVLCMMLLVGGLFFYYGNQLESISPEQLAKRVQGTVTEYYGRNGKLLWEDKGRGNYRLVVKSDEISDYMKQATVAIEDKTFYDHGGISVSGIMRAAWVDLTTDSVQGGSTLTQQLVKQVFLAESAHKRGIGGIPRKIKEAILAIQADSIYTKDQILTMYLNASPYGGRRNGVESAAQTYFNKSADKLTIAESALLAAIPQSPSYYDPYYAMDHKQARSDLIDRQQRTITYMREQGYITQKQAQDAKEVAVLDKIEPLANQFASVKAPHFLQMVKAQLEAKLGKKIVGQGGLKVETTLNLQAQEVLNQEMKELFESNLPQIAGFDNSAMTMVDVETGQILAMRGSRNYDYPGYGSVNAATAYIQPGSSIKPLVYAGLFKPRQGKNYGAGSIIADKPIPQTVYRTADGKSVQNFDFEFEGNITVRRALAESRNIPAIKAMYIAGRDTTLDTIHSMGDKSYCTRGADQTVGLAAAIGGCGLLQTEHVNAFATLARMGKYKPVSSILKVTNNAGQVIYNWKDEPKQVIDPQITYMINDILSDDNARSGTFGNNAPGFVVPGVKTATKSGTSNIGGSAKDLWLMSYTPKAAFGIWVGNHVPEPLNRGVYSTMLGPTVADIMRKTHLDIFAKNDSWSEGDWFSQPKKLQTLTVNGHKDLFPSWFNKKESANYTEMTFDRVSKYKADDCTPERAKIKEYVSVIKDPVTENKTYLPPMGYDASKEDDVHKCSNKNHSPTITNVEWSKNQIRARVTSSLAPVRSVEFAIGGDTYTANRSGDYWVAELNIDGKDYDSARVTAVDDLYYAGSKTVTD